MSVRFFEDFIVPHFLKAADGYLEPGYRYQFKSPDVENSLKLYRAFTHHKSGLGVLTVEGTSLPYLSCSGVKLLPVIHKNGCEAGYTENFISFLRDQVASQKGEFEGTALLIIHNSLLDTLINSAEDISATGGIFDPANIKNSLAELIDDSDAASGKAISKILLDYQYDLITEDKGSMFGFQPLHEAIADGDIRFHEIDLLEDPAILSMCNGSEPTDSEKKQVRKRLDQNKALFDEISEVVEHYSDQLADHLPDFSDEFISKNFKKDIPENWKAVTYDEFLKEQERNREQTLVLIDESSATGKIVVRTKSEATAAQRERHVLLEVDDDRQDFDVSFSFTGSKILNKEVKLTDKAKALDLSNIQLSGGHANSSLTLTGQIVDKPIYFQIALNRPKTSEKYKFKCLVVKKGWFNTTALENSFLINPAKLTVSLQTQESELAISLSGGENRLQLSEVGQRINISGHDIVDYEAIANEEERISFVLANGNAELHFDIEGAAATETLTLPLLLDQTRDKKLFRHSFFGVFNRSKQRIYVENKELKSTKSALNLLNNEADWVDESLLFVGLEGAKTSIDDIGEIAPTLQTAYSDLFTYYKDNNTLPSLCGWGKDYQLLVQTVVNEYLSYLNGIEHKKTLDSQTKDILQIGFLLQESPEHLPAGEWITPFHPLVLAYYLHLVQQATMKGDDSFFKLPKVTLNRLNAQGLLPYIYDSNHEFSYVKAVEHNCFWLHCVPYQDTNYSYVTKLVHDKITEFSSAFSSLFNTKELAARPTLTINSINNYDNHELFMGITEYVIRQRNKCFDIHVNLYDDHLQTTEFDLFSEMASYDQIKQAYGLNKGKVKDHADTIVDLLRTRVGYSKFTHSDVSEQAYAHLSFFRNNQKVTVIDDVNPADKLCGISCNGMINGEASSNEGNNFITGFGLNGLEYDNNPAIDVALLLNRLIKPARCGTKTYSENSAISLAVDDKFKELLERSYDSSIWTTIIDPKVTLDFFESSKDMLLIHYSDQYTSSAGYDAITVTRQTELYDRVLEKEEGGLVSEFNAFNGEWLLKMITDNPNIRKERKGILAAYKLISCLLSKSDITWVPMSAAEMVRVSGNIGLSISESEFSRRLQGFKSGPISDDVLFVGFKENNLYLLPLEVKTGVNYNSDKAIKQSKELSKYLSELLSGDKLSARLFRGLFVRQALMQIDKYDLYDVYNEDYFTPFLERKEWWLQGEYTLAKLESYPEGFVVANLETEKCYETTAKLVDNILKIEVPSSFMAATISTPLMELWTDHSYTAAAKLQDKYFLTKDTASTQATVDIAEEPADQSVKVAEQEVTVQSEVAEDTATPSLTETTPQESLKVLIGHEINHQEPIYWEPTNTAKFMNTNSGIIGTMGTGKTQCTKSVVTQLYRNQHQNIDGKPIGMLIFDYKSDYVDEQFLSSTQGKKFNLHKLPYNPLSLFGDTPMLPVHTARGFSETMGRAFGLGQKQQLRLRKLIAEAYELAGISKSDKSTWSKPAPTIRDVWALFIEQEKVEEDSLYAALESLYELEIFEDDINQCVSLYDLVDCITVVELAGYPSQIQNLVVALTLDLFYSQMQKQGKPQVHGDFRQITKMILVDEADNFMSQDFPSLRKILKEGREYGVGITLSTQDITHFKTKENDYSAYILSWVVHRVSQIKNQDIKSLFNKDDKHEQELLMKTIRELEKHHSLYIDGDKKICKVKDLAFWELIVS